MGELPINVEKLFEGTYPGRVLAGWWRAEAACMPVSVWSPVLRGSDPCLSYQGKSLDPLCEDYSYVHVLEVTIERSSASVTFFGLVS